MLLLLHHAIIEGCIVHGTINLLHISVVLLLFLRHLFLLFLSERIASRRFFPVLEALENGTSFVLAIFRPLLPLGLHLPEHRQYLNEVTAPLKAQSMIPRDLRVSALLFVSFSEYTEQKVLDLGLVILLGSGTQDRLHALQVLQLAHQVGFDISNFGVSRILLHNIKALGDAIELAVVCNHWEMSLQLQ